jgi:putative transposase
VRRKWTFEQQRKPSRPAIQDELRQLMLKLAGENSRWGYTRIADELCKLGYNVSRSTVRNGLKQHGIPAAGQRQPQSSWRTFLRHYQQHALAYDFFTVETLGLKTLYFLFFIELGTRRVHVSGCTEQPNSAWVTQQARQLCWNLPEQHFRVLIHDRDSKFMASFDAVFTAECMQVVLTPAQAPNVNAFVERWVRTVREEVSTICSSPAKNTCEPCYASTSSSTTRAVLNKGSLLIHPHMPLQNPPTGFCYSTRPPRWYYPRLPSHGSIALVACFYTVRR